MKLFFKKNFYPLALGLIVSFLCWRNFTPNTFLTGWDNLMPELNIWLNLKRSFFAVWQNYQGLGLVGGMAHSTDLIRQLIILPFTFILPLNLVRYLWHFAMIFLGTFGVYFGLSKIIKLKPSSSFIAALFYLLSFGSVQNFWVPLETFSCFWGFFPWLIFSLLDYLKNPTTSKLSKLLIFNLLAIPSFYVQTVFIVYLLVLFIIFIIYPKSFFTLIKIGLINSFWLLPLIYFLTTNLNGPANGFGNLMSNDETFLRNFYRGGILDFLLLRGYYYDFPKNYGFLMNIWRQFFSSPIPIITGILLGLSAISGFIITSIKKNKTIFDKFLIGLFLLSAIALLSQIPPFAQINYLLRQIPLINQIFRSPFTKFITPAVFVFSCLIANLIEKISLKFQKYISLLAFISIIIFSFPSFNGHYISPDMRKNIPQEYFDLINFFKIQNPNGRIANLPQGSFWGWTNYRFGISGSGFLWYGIEQPILDRAFDVWNLKNEQYYWELNTALQKDNYLELNKIFEKYAIQYVIFDNNVFFPDEKIYNNIAITTKEKLDNLSSLQKIAEFGQITVYQTPFITQKYFVNNPVSINKFNFYYSDPAFSKFNNYINSHQINYHFPFVNLFTNRLLSEQEFSVSKNESSIIINFQNQNLSFNLDNSANAEYNIGLPNEKTSLTVYNFPQAKLNQNYLVEVNYKFISGLPSQISVVSTNYRHKYFDTKLKKSTTDTTSWFIIPAHETEDFQPGIDIIFNNSYLSEIPSQNQINFVKIYPFDLNSLINQYQFLSPPQSSTYIFYPQSYSSGWLAFYFDGLKPIFLKNHVLANNWANAWLVGQDYEVVGGELPKIYVLFWPQIFQYIGLIITATTLILVLKKSKK